MHSLETKILIALCGAVCVVGCTVSQRPSSAGVTATGPGDGGVTPAPGSKYVVRIKERRRWRASAPTDNETALKRFLDNKGAKYNLRFKPLYATSGKKLRNGEPDADCGCPEPDDPDAGWKVSASHISQRVGFDSVAALNDFVDGLE